MKNVFVNLILTTALCAALPMGAQQPVQERVHKRTAPTEAPRISFAGKQSAPHLFRSAAAGITADFSCQSTGSEVTMWEEDFDDGTDGWTLNNVTGISWQLMQYASSEEPDRAFSTYDPDDVQSLYIDGPFRYAERGIATATSPQLDVPANAMLKGYVGFSQNMDEYCRLHISVSTDAFATSELLWNSADENGEKPWRWHEFSVSLEKYAGQQVQIRFTYTSGKDDPFNSGGYMGDFAIDGLKLTGVSAIEQVAVNTGEEIAFADISTGNPTAWQWSFPGGTPATSTEQNPVVAYNFRHQQSVALHVANEHGESDDATDVSVEYSGLITNFEPGDQATTFDLEGDGTFPGTNSMGITAYAEKFSKPSRPILVFGAYVYFVTASAVDLLDQIADVGVHLCTSENGLPGKKLDSTWWRVFELDTPSGNTMVGTEFAFNPKVIDDEFFIVVDGIPEKNDSVDVSFAMARFRDHGNTAYMYKDKEWIDVSTYFPAGANHTSYMIMPSIIHSVMSPIPADREPLVVGKEAGTSKYPFFSIYGYETPIKSDAEWCRVIGKPNGLTLDTLVISYDRLPDGIEERVATLTLNDSISTYDIKVTQNVNGVSAVDPVIAPQVTLYPTVFDQEVTVEFPEGARAVIVSDESGRTMYRRELDKTERQATIDASAWTSGTYFVRVVREHEATVVKGIKR